MNLPAGLYDLLITEAIEKSIDETAEVKELTSNMVDYMIDTVARQLELALENFSTEGENESGNSQLAVVNEILQLVKDKLLKEPRTQQAADLIELVSPPSRRLEAIKHGLEDIVVPEVRLSQPWLFTSGKNSPSLLQEIRKELASANQVDILVSFITTSGVRKLQDVFNQISAIDADGKSRTRIRVLTTTYTGATEIKALDELARLPNCEVRVSLDGRRTRLHAKAWIFHRSTGFGSAYIGSANLSGAALTGGLEWTVKLAEHGQQPLFTRACAHFETLWCDSEFQSYDPNNDNHRNALAAALHIESGGNSKRDDNFSLPTFFDLEPKSYQLDMLEQLSSEREQGRTRNLIVAATGTGKTMVAAFDYRNFVRRDGGRPRLLFVAHRVEILRQALRTYREVLRDPEFAEILSGDSQPKNFDHLFATIDSISSTDLLRNFGPNHWNVVVIDECHRLGGQRFEELVNTIKPKYLLGLTATPERTDGKPIDQHFDAKPDGSPSVEMRLWHALELQLLSPFEYYACDDETDFTSVPWDQAGERQAIDRIVASNAIRAQTAIREWTRLSSNASVNGNPNLIQLSPASAIEY